MRRLTMAVARRPAAAAALEGMSFLPAPRALMDRSMRSQRVAWYERQAARHLRLAYYAATGREWRG